MIPQNRYPNPNLDRDAAYAEYIGTTVAARMIGLDPEALGANLHDVMYEKLTALHERLDAKYPRPEGEAAKERAIQDLVDILPEVYKDPSGVDPAGYVSPDMFAFLGRLKEVADANKQKIKDPKTGEVEYVWPGADEMMHTDVTAHAVHPGNRQERQHQKDHNADPYIRDENGRKIRGYLIGYLSSMQFTNGVFFCDDGKLRMLISYNQSHSHNHHHRYDGHSTLPPIETIMKARDRWKEYPVEADYNQSKSLQDRIYEMTKGALKVDNTPLINLRTKPPKIEDLLPQGVGYAGPEYKEAYKKLMSGFWAELQLQNKGKATLEKPVVMTAMQEFLAEQERRKKAEEEAAKKPAKPDAGKSTPAAARRTGGRRRR
ncbi:MAG TPA: hypothetical protein VG604_03585 [Candidatus Saccharimonadales bacterium]|nr:hypothetical protein [Candidatus Saccharimonadales bacterium]